MSRKMEFLGDGGLAPGTVGSDAWILHFPHGTNFNALSVPGRSVEVWKLDPDGSCYVRFKTKTQFQLDDTVSTLDVVGIRSTPILWTVIGVGRWSVQMERISMEGAA